MHINVQDPQMNVLMHISDLFQMNTNYDEDFYFFDLHHNYCFGIPSASAALHEVQLCDRRPQIVQLR